MSTVSGDLVNIVAVTSVTRYTAGAGGSKPCVAPHAQPVYKLGEETSVLGHVRGHCYSDVGLACLVWASARNISTTISKFFHISDNTVRNMCTF